MTATISKMQMNNAIKHLTSDLPNFRRHIYPKKAHPHTHTHTQNPIGIRREKKSVMHQRQETGL